MELPDGTTEHWYAELPSAVQATTWAQFTMVTREKGLPPPAAPIAQVLADYVDHLRSLVSSAEVEFGQE